MKRQEFIKILGTLPFAFWNVACHKTNHKKMNFGWTTCLTYETNDRKLGYDYFSNLLDKMHAHGMGH